MSPASGTILGTAVAMRRLSRPASRPKFRARPAGRNVLPTPQKSATSPTPPARYKSLRRLSENHVAASARLMVVTDSEFEPVIEGVKQAEHVPSEGLQAGLTDAPCRRPAQAPVSGVPRPHSLAAKSARAASIFRWALKSLHLGTLLSIFRRRRSTRGLVVRWCWGPARIGLMI